MNSAIQRIVTIQPDVQIEGPQMKNLSGAFSTATPLPVGQCVCFRSQGLNDG
ncbi:hypothetical protein COCON_G00075020 [Conger conger]|uniref:Uncharacterized protein n=1 Tax=Conger conger TaxID=82655 RepID=A0A9Q1I245_CONCO|nr:hypothetical protein COCON_G00075020 [Conger conger]